MAEAETDTTSLVGISLTGETGCCLDDPNQDTSLGFILVDVAGITVEEMRTAMQKQLDTLPSSYRFITKQRWPVTPTQESLIQVKHLINDKGVVRIQPDYAKPRIGVVTEKNDALGFVFISSLNLSISQLREAIVAQLGGSQSVLSSGDSDWMFLDRNRWPICRQQEEALAVIDLVVRASVRIHFCRKFKKSVDSPDHLVVSSQEDMSLTLCTPPAKKHRLHKPSPLGSNDMGYQSSNASYLSHSMRSLSPIPTPHRTDITMASPVPKTPHSAKQILISYVRAEASQYALDLKVELESLNFSVYLCIYQYYISTEVSQHVLDLKVELETLNFSVYLDVHEIFCGSDWQDSLNFAVSNCAVFVPLVTPRYGETQWTNREVKLADVLNKFIVPVSFLETWPPRCLAIQFATTQYISWKLPEPGMKHNEVFFHPIIEKGLDHVEFTFTYIWERPDVAEVAKEIGKRSNAYAKQDNADGSNNKTPMLRSYGSILPPGVGNLAIVQESREGKPLVVISVHPKQRSYAQELVGIFEDEGYEVWCSTDVLDESAQTYQPNSNLDESDTLMIEDVELNESDVDALSLEPVKQFVAKADEAGVVIFLLSMAFAESVTCKEQVFYCETRKRVVPLAYEHFEMPSWMSMLIGTSTMEHVQRENYKECLLSRVKRCLNSNPSDIVSDVAKEAQISKYVEYVCNKLPEDTSVYISGGTMFYCDKSEEICKAIGRSLAKQDCVTLVTGGFYGVGETISKSFLEERKRRHLKHNVFHILPIKDEQDRSAQGRQNPDKTFKEVPFGQTLFYGENVRQRESIVSRVFDICILVEGGPGAAHEAEEFTWSDHTVIPIRCTGGAAGGKFKVPEKIFEVPPGVSRDDWNLLGDTNISATKIGDAVARIVNAIQTGVAAQFTRMKSCTSKRSSLISQQSIVESV